MIRYRWAVRRELSELLNLIEDGFSWQGAEIDRQEGDEHRILFDYLYSRSSWKPDQVWVGEAEGRLVTAVGFFPQQLSLDGAFIPVWAVSPVVTASDYRGRGLAGQCLTEALKMVKKQGVTAVFLWGIPAFYPRFGFVPVFSRYKTKLEQPYSLKKAAPSRGQFRPLDAADLPKISAIYDLRQSDLWLQPARSLQWWQERVAEMDCDLAEIREVPYPRKSNFLVWENVAEGVAGYLYYKVESGHNRTVILESGAANYSNAMAMMRSFAMDFWVEGRVLWIRGTAQHYLNMAAYRLGGMHLAPAPLAGMIKVLDWPGFLASYFKAGLPHAAVLNDNVTLSIPFEDNGILRRLTVNPAGYELTDGSGGGARLAASQMTRLLMGTYDWEDIAILEHRKRDLTLFFPARNPFIWDANYLY